MTKLWFLPSSLTVGEKEYGINGDFRDILEIFSYFQDETLPEFVRWQIGLRLFYKERIPPEEQREAMEKMAEFISCGQKAAPGPCLVHWEKDAGMIIADINRTASQEIRAVPFVHWWTFLAWFHGIGEGQFSTVVGIRDKLRRGKKLEDWEKEYYRNNKDRIDLPKNLTPQQQAEKDRLLALLGD